MWCVAQHALALVQCFVDEANLSLLEVAKSSVGELARLARGAGGEIVSFDEGHRETARCRIQGHTEAGDPATDDEEIKSMGSQRVQMLVAAKIHGHTLNGGIDASPHRLQM